VLVAYDRRVMQAPPTNGHAPSRRIAMLAYDGAQTLDVTGPLEVFSIASEHLRVQSPTLTPPYQIEILAEHDGPVRMASGITLLATRPYAAVRGGIDTLLVAGGDPHRPMADTRLLAWLRRMATRVRRLGAVCSGAFILAEAGLLDGKRATTHWAAADLLARSYPSVQVDPDAIFVIDGATYTSAGITAGMDLALALVQEDFDHATALAVARHLVMFLKRPGGQSQFSAHLAAQSMPRSSLEQLPQWIVEHLDADLSVESLAARIAMSPRNFARVFRRELGVTPAKFVERARLEEARRILEDTEMSVDAIAERCGFSSAERMRRTFHRHLHVVPRDYRLRFDHRPTAAGPAVRRETRAARRSRPRRRTL
jgi:transcriptional regulator GlxA family with amidase domain